MTNMTNITTKKLKFMQRFLLKKFPTKLSCIIDLHTKVQRLQYKCNNLIVKALLGNKSNFNDNIEATVILFRL